MEKGGINGRESGSARIFFFFFAAASSPLAVQPACSPNSIATGPPKGWELVNSWGISSEFPPPPKETTVTGPIRTAS